MNATRAPLGTRALGAALLALPALGILACAAPRAAEPRLGGLPPSPPLSPALSPSPATAPGPPSSRLTPTSEAARASAPSTTAAIPPPGTPFGASAPLTLVAAAPDRRWLALCQATRDTTGDGAVDVVVGPQGSLSGDALEGFLDEGSGPGRAIDAFVGSDPTGRFVAFVERGRLLLRDTTTQVDTDLGARGADVRDDLAPFLSPRAGAFSPLGARFLYLRRDGDRSKVVVRDLATGNETVLEPKGGDLYRADFDASGEWVVLRVATADTNGNGKIEWPFPEAPARMRCTLPVPRFAVWERPHDEPTVFVARATGGGGPVTEAPGLVTPVGDAVVLRDPDDSLVRVRADGTRTNLTRKACAAHLLHVDAARGLLLVSCLGKKGLSDALLVGPDFTKPLGVELSAVTGDHVQSGAPRLVALHPGTNAVLVDLDEKAALHLTPLDRIIATVGTRALVLRGHTLVVHDIAGSTETKLGDVTPLGHVQRAGGVVVVPPLVVDVATGELLGTTSARPMAVSTDGSVLVPDGRDADATHLAVGPLRWKRPAASLGPGATNAPASP